MKMRFNSDEVSKFFSVEEIARKATEAVLKIGPESKIKINSCVKVPGAYEIYALGTSVDITLLVWFHVDGSVTVDVVTW